MRRRRAHPFVAPLAVTLTIVAALLLSSVPARTAGSADLGRAPGSYIEITDAAFIHITNATSYALPRTVAPVDSPPAYVAPDLVTAVKWSVEDPSVRDPTGSGSGLLTPRTEAMLQAAIGFGLTTTKTSSCIGSRSSNSTSDHPRGLACDLMFAYTTPQGLDAGWRAANWLVANQAALGVKYVIWQGMTWMANSKPGEWTPYVSPAYGCPNPANVTGCHYDHVHVSMY